MRHLLFILCGIGLLACKQPQNQTPPAKPVEPTATTTATKPDTKTPTAETKPSSSPSMVASIQKPKEEPKKYDKPTERRLYTNRVEASERIHDDLHPFFLMDNDDDTSWGFLPDEKPSWAKVKLSPVEGATSVRLKVSLTKTSLGYAKDLTIIALPGGQTITTTLAMSDDWQEVSFDLTTAKIDKEKIQPASAPSTQSNKEINLNGLEFRFTGTQQQKDDKEAEDLKYDEWGAYGVGWAGHVEIAEIEVYVTALTKENPAFEKEKLEQIENWNKARNANLTQKGIPLPVAKEYQANLIKDGIEGLIKEEPEEEEDDTEDEDEDEYDYYEDPFAEELLYFEALDALEKYLPSYAKASLERARAAIGISADEVPLLVTSTALKPYVLPPGTTGVEDLISSASHMNGISPTDFSLPDYEYGTLLLKEQFTVADSKATKRPDNCGDKAQTYFARKAKTDPEKLDELIVHNCLETMERAGMALYSATEVLEYDEKGRLQLWVTPFFIQWFDWKDIEKGSFLIGAIRIDKTSITRFIDATAAATPFNDDKAWLALASSKPLFDAESEKASNELKDKLVVAGFTEAEIFDSRKAKNLSCCFLVVVAGRYKTKEEAQATVKKLKEKSFDSYVKQGW